jgi:hypothetical protein
MARILLILCLAAASLAAKDRAWQTGTLLDKSLNPYFRAVSGNRSADKSEDATVMYGSVAVAVNVRQSTGDLIFDDYVIQGEDTVYLVEGSRFKSFKAPHLSLSLPFSFAVEKNKLIIMDLDRNEYETAILKQTPKNAQVHGDVVAAVQPKPEPAKPEPAKTADAKAAPVKAPAKPDPFAVASAKSLVSQTPSAAPAAPVAQPTPPAPAPKPDPKPAPKVEAAVSTPPAKPVAPAPKPESKPAPKVEAAVSTPPAKPAPAPKPESAVSVKASSKDRAWQSGQLLSIINNTYFFNVTYSSDTDGSAWPFVQGSDGRYTVNGQIGNPTNSLYTYDNYVIESQFCVYLVQRMRPKASPTVRLPGTKALKFAVEKNKLWVLDEENIEYETKVVKLVQKDAIVDPLTRAAAR